MTKTKDPLALLSVGYAIRMLKTVRPNRHWAPDTFEMLMQQLEDRSKAVQNGEVLRALECAQLVQIALTHAKLNPSADNKGRIMLRVTQDLLELTKLRPGLDVGDYERVSEVLIECVNALRKFPTTLRRP